MTLCLAIAVSQGVLCERVMATVCEPLYSPVPSSLAHATWTPCAWRTSGMGVSMPLVTRPSPYGRQSHQSSIVAALAANTEDLHGLLTSLMVGVMLIQLLCTPMTFAAKARPTSCPTVLSIGRLHLGGLLLLLNTRRQSCFQQEQEPAEVLAAMASSIESRMWVSLWSAICWILASMLPSRTC